VSRIQEFQNMFLQYVDSGARGLRDKLAQTRDLTSEVEEQLKTALSDFKSKVWKK